MAGKLLPPCRVLRLGDSAAGNTVNTAIYRAHGLLSTSDLQFGAYYRSATGLILFRRAFADDSLELVELPGEYGIGDAHNVASLGIDRQGHLHLTYDQHDSALRYRRSERPYDITSFGPEIPMAGGDETRITYPGFIVPSHAGLPLLCLYRTGYAGRGDAWLYAYDETEQRWLPRAAPLLAGAAHQPWPCSPYWNRVACAPDGHLHLSFCWRTHTLDDERQRVNNGSIGYAMSPDWGEHWHSSRGLPLRLPLTPVNAETALGLPPASNLINQTGSALDSAGQPHVVFYGDDAHGVPQYWHLWHADGTWKHHPISNRNQRFSLEGRGTLAPPMSRPELVIDAFDHVYVLFRADLTGHRLAALRLDPPHYLPEPDALRILWDSPLGYTEPVIDTTRWAREGVLSMFLQRTPHAAPDGNYTAASAPAFVADWNLVRDWEST